MKTYLEIADSVLARRDRYIAERRGKRKQAVSVLSCLCLAALLSAGAWHTWGIPHTGADAGMGGYPARKEHTEQQTDRKEPVPGDPAGDGETAPADAVPPGPYTDATVQGEHGSTGALTPYEAVWGGSYMDQDGRWVVWLTENTPENQKRVLELNPGLSESGTVFQTADYSLVYLTELMSKISGEMGTGRLLDFVSTAALREERNRVEVTLTTEDAESVSKVLALDTVGGAIEIRYGSGYAAAGDIVKGPAQ